MARRGVVESGSKTALVTGASKGIGRCFALRLASMGYNVVMVSLTADDLEAAAKEVSAVNDRVWVRHLVKDMAEMTSAEELFAWTEAEGIKVDVLINNAGIFSFCDILNTPIERIQRMIYLHDITSTLNCRLYAADMIKRGGGRILNMSSFSIWMPYPGLSLYSASKAYLKSFSVAFAKEMRYKNVWVTAVCPAGIATDLYGLTKKWQGIGLKLHALSTPSFCARRGLNSLWRKRKCIVPDWWCKAFIPICLALPRFALNWLRNFTAKWQK